MRKVLLIVFSCVGALTIGASTVGFVSADTINAPDWSNVSGTSFGWDNSGKIAASNDGNHFYFLFNKGTSNWGTPGQYYVKVGNKNYCIKLENGSVTAQDTTDGWKSLGTVGTYTTSSNKTEGKIDLSKLNIKQTTDSQTIEFSTDGISSTKTTLAAIEENSDSSSTSTTDSSSSSNTADNSSSDAVSQALAGSDSDQASSSSAQANNNNTSGNLGITINGDFGDWADKTKSDMYATGDKDNLKKVSLLADKDNVYFYVSMEPKLGNGGTSGYANFQPSGYSLTVGGVVYDISFNGNQTVSMNVGDKKVVSVNVYNEKTGASKTYTDGAYVANQKLTQKNGDGKEVTGNGYVLECAVPFSGLGGTSNTTGQTITLANGNL